MTSLRRAPGGALTRAAALLVAAALSPTASLPAAPATTSVPVAVAPEAPIAADPAVRRGVLANGLRYAVMRAANPAGAVSMRLGIEAGSYEEGADERGFAHFIEHMAFRSTRAFPDNAVDGAFASRGVAFGRDINAGAGLFSPRFKLDLPHLGPDDVAFGLRWLRAVADGVVFETDGLGKERGVVLAEGDITPQDLDAARAPLLALDRQQMTANAHWAAALSRASLDDQPVTEMTAHADVLASLSLAEVKAAAADWLARPPFVAAVVPGAGAGPAQPPRPAPEAKPPAPPGAATTPPSPPIPS